MEPDAPTRSRSCFLLLAAIEYAHLGWAVFAVRAGEKTPITEHGCKDATTDPYLIREWWNRWPKANIGLATGRMSGLVALDFDVKNGKSGLATWDAIHQKFEIATRTAETPSGGCHELYQYPGPILRNAVDRLPGLDIRTDGGYILVAPSIVGVKPYRWTHVVRPAEMPVGLIELLQTPKLTPTTAQPLIWTSNRLELIERARRYVAAVPGAIQGRDGDITTYKLACRLVRGFGLYDDEAFMLLSTWNWRCQPQWSERELIAKITSARRNGVEPIGAKLEVLR